MKADHQQFSSRLLTWYDEAQRTLPWRGEKDPYRVWISEVMLQQTQVETVIPYFTKWVTRFPSVQSVAEAKLDDLLKIWEGLGYYARCRNFYKACKLVVAEHDGMVPGRWELFRALPGVGDYTAAAVLSIAFYKPYPVLDGNVKRVMARLLAFGAEVERGSRLFHQRLNEWSDADRPGDFNQAMMELGSQVCRRNDPHCFECPVASICLGHCEGDPTAYPVVPQKRRRPHRTIVAGVVWRDGKFLIQRRPEEGLLGGLWEFPGGKVERGESLHAALVREIEEETGLVTTPSRKVGSVDHAYTHFSITLHLYHCTPVDDPGPNGLLAHQQWIEPEERSRFAFPRANHKLFEILESQSWAAGD